MRSLNQRWAWMRRAPRGRKSFHGLPRKVAHRRLLLEPLEPRMVLSSSLVISEFLADNTHTLRDVDGDYSDWIEIHNPTQGTVSLQNWYLTDTKGDPGEWAFPAKDLRPGRYLVVFASGKDRRDPAEELHTNFSLKASGEYLGLVRYDTGTQQYIFEDEYAPKFPAQLPNISYGRTGQSFAQTFLAIGSQAKGLVPADGSLDTAWTGGDEPFNDSSWPISGPAGLGYEAAGPPPPANPANWSVVQASSAGTLATVSDAAALLASGGQSFAAAVINFADPQNSSGGHFGGSSPFPGDTPVDDNDFAVRLTGRITIPTTGPWTFGVSSDEGFQLRIAGATFTRVTGSGTTINGDTMQFSGTRTSADSLGIVDNMLAGDYDVGLTYFEHQGGASLEFYAAPGAWSSYAATNSWRLVGDAISGGVPVKGFGNLIMTNVQSQMMGVNSTAYFRFAFDVANPTWFDSLTLKMRYDDAFIAYLNGQEIARSDYAPDTPAWNSAATGDRPAGLARLAEAYDVSDYLGLLRSTHNVLAIQALNDSAGSRDLLVLPELAGAGFNPNVIYTGYFTTPTPEARNNTAITNLGPIIADVSAPKTQPGDNDPILVTASILPSFYPVLAGSPTLHYRVMFNAEQALPMYDDGLHGDGQAGDGSYGATIPATASGPGQMVRWYVTAADTTGRNSRWPLFPDSTSSAQYLGTVIANPALTSALPIFQWFVQNPTAAATDAGTQCSVFYAGRFYDNAHVELRGQTARGWPKPHLKFKFNPGEHFYYAADRDPVQEFNLNSSYSDKSYLRTILSWETYRDLGAPYSESFPLRVQQNNAFYSVAFFLEEPEGEYFTRQGMYDGGALYKSYGAGGPGFSSAPFVKKNPDDNDRSDLDQLANAIRYSQGLTGNARIQYLTRYLFDNFDVPEVINAWVANTLIGDNDDTQKNYFLYRDTFDPIDNPNGTNEWRMLHWDKDLTFGRNFVPWAGGVLSDPIWANYDDLQYCQERGLSYPSGVSPSHPLYGSRGYAKVGDANAWNGIIDAFLAVPQIKQMYLRRLRTAMDQVLQPPGTPANQLHYETRIDQLYNQMLPDVVSDRAKWGNPYGANQDFATAVSILKNQYLAVRRTHLYVDHSTNTSYPAFAGIPAAQASAPTITFGTIDYNPVSHNQDEEYIELRNPNSFAVDISGWKLSGEVQLTFEGGTVLAANSSLYITPNPAAFRARATGPRGGQGLFIQGKYSGHLSALGGTLVLSNAAGTQVATLTYAGNPSDAQRYLRVTEISYHPYAPTAAELAANSQLTANDFEFIELENTSETVAVNLSNVHFTPNLDTGSGIQLNFTGSGVTSLAPGQYVVVAKNPAALSLRYDTAGLTIVGPYTGLLSNAGETVRLYDAVNEKINEIHYQDTGDWPGRTDGQGSTLAIIDVAGEDNDPANWRSSYEYGGSPGRAGLEPVTDVVVNEVLSHSDPPLFDSIELYNTTDSAVSIGGWYLSDSSKDYQKFRIPDGTVISAHQYVVLDEQTFGISEYAWATEGIGGSTTVEDTGATLHLIGNAWRKVKLPYTVTPNTILEFDYKSPIEGEVQGIGLDSDDAASPQTIFRLYGTESWGTANYANYSGTAWKHYTISVGQFFTGAMSYLVFANGDAGGLPNAESYFRNVKVHEGAGGTPVNFEQYFSLDGAHGDDVWLMKTGAGGSLTYFADHADFGAGANGVSFGRWPDDEGNWRMAPLEHRTLGGPNDAGQNAPQFGPLVLSEVMYNPVGPAGSFFDPQDFEYIEVYNPTSRAVDLTNWRIHKGVDFDFDPGTTLGPRTALLVVPFNPADPLNKPKLDAFKSYYGIGPAVQIVGGYQGRLSNTGDKVQLQRPDSPPLDEPGFYPGLLADEVVYGTAAPWPAEANGLGQSLVRQGIVEWGDNAVSWAAAAPTPGMVDLPAVIVARQVFYNNSAFDDNNPAAGAQDDGAIAADKQVLLPGQTATFVNYTSFVHGINGIMIDVAGLGSGLSAADFSLRVGNDNAPGSWAAAPPTSVTVRPGAGLGGSDRVELIWPDGAIVNRWLQVTLLGTPPTNLAAPDVFYVGSAIGDTGNDPANALVNAADVIVARQSKTGFAPAAITANCDFNRDGRVNATDEIIARSHRTGFADALRLITTPAGSAGVMTAQKAATVGRAPSHEAATVGRATMTSVSPTAALQAHDAVLAVADGKLSAENWLRQWAWFDALQPASEKKTTAKKGGAVQAAAVDAVLAELET